MMAVNVGMSRCAIVSAIGLNKAASDVASWPYLDHDYRGQLHELDEFNAERGVADSIHCG